MHPVVEALTPSEARRLVRADSIDTWCAEKGIPFSRAIMFFVVGRSQEPEPPPPPVVDPRRYDAHELREFVGRAAKLPTRLLDVADLCLVRGYTLDECAAALGIKRETVRSHLRRLRQLRKMVLARDQRAGTMMAPSRT